MGKIFKIVFFLISTLLFVYIILPSPNFPADPPNSLQSKEPADLESPLRRGYYTNLTRQEVMEYYEKEFNKGFIYAPRLNYPPEESQTIIRDQTRSTYLEEITHPLRESLFISGLESKNSIYEFKFNGLTWEQKIIIKYVPSSIYIRIIIALLSTILALWLVKEYLNVRKD